MPEEPESDARSDFELRESEDPRSDAPPASGGVRLRPSSQAGGSDADVTPNQAGSSSAPVKGRTPGDASKATPAGTADPTGGTAGSSVSDVPGGAAGKIGTPTTPGAQTPSTTSTQAATEEANHDVHDYNVGDQPTPQDTLGFEPYVKAIASFLTNDSTHAPLTLSIEGEWGSGKSSFMLQLMEELKKEPSEVVVDFNAWQYDKDEAMWAAFALKCTRQISDSDHLGLFRRWLAHLQLFFSRFSWERGWLDMAKLVLMLMVLVTILVLPLLARDRIWEFVAPASPSATAAPASGQTDSFLTSSIRKLLGAGGSLAYLALVFGLFRKAKDVVGNPLTINLKQHLDTPDYKSRVAFIDHFQEDFREIVRIYGRGRKVFVFIDDLDRCEVPKAADLMQALNLMISGNNQLIFIMGLDREKVAAGLAVKYEKLLPYLAPAAKGARPTATFDPVLGLEYGYNFIEKFIQLPFLVPQASEPQVKGFLEHILGTSDSSAPGQQLPPGLQAAAAGESAERTVTENTEMVTQILKMVAPTFDYNPRRLKQFINAFRLKTFIASRTGLFGEPQDTTSYDRLTTYQLGKFVAISLRWPLLLADLDNERDLLKRLQILSLNKNKITPDDLVEMVGEREVLKPKIDLATGGQVEVTEALIRWYRRDSLRKLLCVKPLTEKGAEADLRLFSLDKLNVNKLLEVSPLNRPAPPPTVAVAH